MRTEKPTTPSPGRPIHADSLAYTTSNHVANSRNVIEHQPGLICRVRDDLSIMYANKAFRDFHGRTRDQLIGLSFLELLAPATKSELQGAIRFLQADQPVCTIDIECEFSSSNRWLRWGIEGVFDTSGGATEYFFMGHDITDLQMPAKVSSPTDFIIDDLAVLICRFTPDTRITFANPAFCDHFGTNEQSMVGRSIATLFGSDDFVQLAREISSLTPNHPITEIAYLQSRANDRFSHRWQFRAIFNHVNEIQEFFAIGQDITTERRSEKRFRLVTDEQPDLISCATPQYILTYINQSYHQHFAEDHDELIGQNFIDLYPPCEHETMRRLLGTLSPENQMVRKDVVIKNDQPGWIEWIYKGVFDEGGQLTEIWTFGRDVTEQRLTEIRLRESEELYRTIVHEQTQLIARCAQDGTFLFVNDAFCQFFGKSREVLIGIGFDTLFLEQDLSILRQQFAELAPGHPTFISDNQSIAANGDARWIRWTHLALFDEDGNILQIQSVGQDITGHKGTQEALERSEQELRSLIHNSPDLIARYDRELRYVFASPGLLQAFGLQQAECLGKRNEELPIPRRLTHVLDDAISQVIATGQEKRIEFEFPGAKETRQYESLAVPELTDEGIVEKVLVISRDITDRVQSDRKLRESESLFRQLIENIHEGFYNADVRTGRIIYASPVFAQMMGKTEEEIKSNPMALFDAIHPDDRELVMAQMAQLITGDGIQYECRLQNDTNGLRWVRCSAFPLKQNDTVVQVVGLMEDITDQRQMAEQKLELVLERERSKILADFIHDASHEFKTPLSTINVNTYLIEKTTQFDKHKEYLNTIKSESAKIQKLIESMVLMIRLDHDFELDTEHCQPNDLVEIATTALEEFAKTQQITVQLDLNPRVTDMQADSDLLRLAIQNVLENAILYSQRGATVTVVTDCAADYVMIEIVDSGIGIATDDVDRIFERFYRIDPARSHRGFGLGLPTVKRIVELHNGRIDVESRLGEGSLFRLILPRQ